MLLIGQSLECWRPPLATAVARRDPAPLIARARRQLEAGAAALDVNFGAESREGLAADLAWTAAALRAALPDLPLFLDCGDLEALATAVEVTPGPVVINAVPLEAAPTSAVERLLEVAAGGAGVVFSPRAADATDTPAAIIDAAEAASVLADRFRLRGPLYLDCLAYPAALFPERCRRSLAWIALLRTHAGAHLEPLVAVGNVAHGAPEELRAALEECYVVLAVAMGAKTLLLRAEHSQFKGLIEVMTRDRADATDLEAWALDVQSRGSAAWSTLPPPAQCGDTYARAWALLTASLG